LIPYAKNDVYLPFLETANPMSLPVFKRLVEGLLHLFYPNLCAGCQHDLPASAQQCFCIRCQQKILFTDHFQNPDNEFAKRLWGRIRLEHAAALYELHKKSPVHRALWRLKYGNQPQTGRQLGQQFGRIWLQNPGWKKVDALIPVPLHPLRQRQRGYNQSAMFAEGISAVTNIPVLADALQRVVYTESQTTKKRIQRFENVNDVFVVRQPDRLAHKHILLLDDVLTTGATLEACGHQLLSVPGVQLSMATIAIRMQ
jgi:competence protein ComFC